MSSAILLIRHAAFTTTWLLLSSSPYFKKLPLCIKIRRWLPLLVLSWMKADLADLLVR